MHRILITTGNQNHAHEEYLIQFLSLHYAGIVLREIGYKFGGIIRCLQVKWNNYQEVTFTGTLMETKLTESKEIITYVKH